MKGWPDKESGGEQCFWLREQHVSSPSGKIKAIVGVQWGQSQGWISQCGMKVERSWLRWGDVARSRSPDVIQAVGSHGGDWLGGGTPPPPASVWRSGHRTKSGDREDSAEAGAAVQRGAAAARTRCGQIWEVFQAHRGQGLRTG